MKIDFIKLSPTQNMTILVQSALPREKQAQAAAQLMAYDGVFAEQVGFIEKTLDPAADARLQMMGGEFCGNASMSLAAWLYASGQKKSEYVLECSGLSQTFRCAVQPCGEERFCCSVEMPLPLSVGEERLALGGESFSCGVVSFPGITHVIVPVPDFSAQICQAAESAARQWAETRALPALGVILYMETAACIRPLVYVRQTDSLVWERGCASGTAALGAWRFSQCGEAVDLEIAQPGGVLRVSAAGRQITLRGEVRLVAQGTAWVDAD